MVAQPTAIDPDGLEAYFTDVEHLRDAFKALVAAPALPKRLLVIHGVGGVGKSSLLRMFRLHCKSVHAPMGLASGDEAKSAVDVFAAWTDDLKADGVKLPTFTKTFAHYRAIQAKVEEHARNSSGVMGKLAVKTAEGVAGSMAGAAIGSVIPIVGTLAGAAVGALVGTSGEALTDWLGGFLNRPDIDLLLDPVKRLTDDFLADLARAAPKRRLVLLLDTFEQLSALEEWARDLAQRLHPNVLLIIAGRAVPNWSRQWMGWPVQADVQELKPMTEEVMRALIERYYATMRGGSPDSAQVTAIVGFARGLPVVVTSAVRLWVEYGVEDFQAIKPQVVADLVDRLLEGVPRTLVPVLEAAAAARWFNKDVLRALLGQSDEASTSQLDVYSPFEAGLRDLLSRLDNKRSEYNDALIYQQRLAENIAQARRYGDDDTRQAERAEIIAQLNTLALKTVGSSFNALCDKFVPLPSRSMPIIDIDGAFNELRRFPFTRPRAEGLALHDIVREVIDEHVRVSSPSRHRTLHERAVDYFQAQVGQLGREAKGAELEILYHQIQAEEGTGIQSFQKLAEELVRYRLIGPLRSLLVSITADQLRLKDSQLWLKYYHARLAYLEMRYKDAEEIYQAIGNDHVADERVRGFAVCDLAWSRRRTEYVIKDGGLRDVLELIEKSKRLLPETDPKIIRNEQALGDAYRRIGDQEQALAHYQKAIELFDQHNDAYNVVTVFSAIRDLYAVLGDWRRMLDVRAIALERARALPQESVVHSNILGGWTAALAMTGRYAETERDSREALAIEQRTAGKTGHGILRRGLGFALGLQGKFAEAHAFFADTVPENAQDRNDEHVRLLAFYGYILLKNSAQDEWQRAEQYLQQAWDVQKKTVNDRGAPQNIAWLGRLAELRCDWQKADDYYQTCVSDDWADRRRYFKSTAFTGHVRVKHAQGDYAAIPALLAEAEQLAQQYEYNDHLASLRLTQGHVAWEGHIPEWGEGFDAALAFYKKALTYALRYNRFLLDEALWGGGVGTPLRPIISWCQQHDDEGQRMLAALRHWWQTGTNDLGAPRPDTISPIPEGILLLEAERIAREREPGDGTPQRTVSDILAEYI